MSRLLEDEQDELPQRERELTLSTGAILAIFLGLMLLCGVFFGFGYNLGRKATTTANAALPGTPSDAEAAETGSSTFDNFKPSPSSPPASTSPATRTSTPAQSHAAIKDREPEAPAARPSPPTPPASRLANSAGPSPRAAAPAIAPGGAFVVQIAAISPTHKDDADLLMNALHGKGYQVAERTGTQDKLIHIQVGPFATKADAEAMRERLIVDGYNAIVK